MKLRTEPCGCGHYHDKQGREQVQMCAKHAAEFAERHQAAVQSGSHVERAKRGEVA
jgi:hypothetical protein